MRLFEMEIIYISSIVNNLCSTVTVLDRLLMLSSNACCVQIKLRGYNSCIFRHVSRLWMEFQPYLDGDLAVA